MYQHPNARLTQAGRRTLVERVESGERISKVAREMGVSPRTARKWLRRAEAGEGLCDRSSRPRSCPRRTDAATEALVVRERLERRCSCLVLSLLTGVPARTCARIVARNGCPRLSEIDPVTGEVLRRGPVTRLRYERDEPGDLVHVDVKKLPSIPDGGGFRARGPRQGEHAGSGRGARCLHVAVDDRSRVCYAELLDDERKGTCTAFARRARGFFRSLGVEVRGMMTDNGPAYHSGQGRADEPHAGAGVGLREAVSERGGEGVRAHRVPRVLQWAEAPQRLRGQAPHVAHRGTTSWHLTGNPL